MNLDSEGRREVLARLNFYQNGSKNCYVIRSGNEIAYLQWIIFPVGKSYYPKKLFEKILPSDRETGND
jgi:hypothetical protein